MASLSFLSGGCTRVSLPVSRRTVHSYANGFDVTDEWHWSNTWGAVDLLSNAGDVLTWMRALLHGRVLSPRALAWMLDFEPVPGAPGEWAGLNVARTELSGLNASVLSAGGTWEAITVAVYVPELDLSGVMLINARYSSSTSWLADKVLMDLVVDLTPRFRALPHSNE